MKYEYSFHLDFYLFLYCDILHVFLLYMYSCIIFLTPLKLCLSPVVGHCPLVENNTVPMCVRQIS